MKLITLSITDNIATVALNRPKVNALNKALVEEIQDCFRELAANFDVSSVILTGEGSFFSFGLDIPEFLNYSRESFTSFLVKFTDLLKYLFIFPKPVVAALNGHTVAGGCMLAIACDYRLMVSEKAKISLNELTFGSTVFASGIEMLKFVVGARIAELILYRGSMFSAEEAKQLGLVDESATRESLGEASLKVAQDFGSRDARAFESLKMLLRGQLVDQMNKRDKDSIPEFVDIWYSETTRKNLEKIKIRD